MAKCPDCKNRQGYKVRVICEQGYGIMGVKEWCERCKGNGHIPPIITMEQYCSVKSDGERE